MIQTMFDDGRAMRLVLEGPIEAEQAEALRAALEAAALAPAGDVEIDLTDVPLIDGSGVGALAFLFKRLHARGRRLRVRGAQGQPLALLQRLGIAGLLGLAAEPVARPLSARGGRARSWMTLATRRLAG